MALRYVKPLGGTGAGSSDASAWSPVHFFTNQASLVQSGDTVLFKTGETYRGRIIPATNNIVYGEYGTGAKPVISGLTLLTSWTLHSGNIYYASLDVPMLNMVVVDGEVQGMGRWPKSDYLVYTSHTGNTSISGATIGALPFNATGGEVVIRKYRWVIDRHLITAHTGNTITYSSSTNGYGNSTAYEPWDGNGFFIQGHIGCLTTDGDWYYDAAAKRLYMYFSATPTGREVYAAAHDRNVQFSATGLILNNLVIEGANIDGLDISYATGIEVNNCDFRRQGGNAVYGLSTSEVLMNGGSITDALNNGIFQEYQGSDWTVQDMILTNCGAIAGAGRSGDGVQNGIFVSGDSTSVLRNQVINTGYNGIHFDGSNVLVEENTVDTFNTLKDDGGGIYAHETAVVSNRIVRNNTILNGVGAWEGAEGNDWEPYGKTCGVYLDNQSNHTEVSDNTIISGGWYGVYINANKDNQILRNKVSGYLYQLGIMNYSAEIIARNLTIQDNIFKARAGEPCLHIELWHNDDLGQMGVFSNNRYDKADGNETIVVDRKYSGGGGEQIMTLKQWKALTGLDTGSISNPKALINNGKILTNDGKFMVVSQ